jgi:hypothetical protein
MSLYLFCSLGKCQTNVRQFPRFLRLFFCIFVTGINLTKIVTKCQQFLQDFFAKQTLNSCQTFHRHFEAYFLYNSFHFPHIWSIPIQNQEYKKKIHNNFVKPSHLEPPSIFSPPHKNNELKVFIFQIFKNF